MNDFNPIRAQPDTKIVAEAPKEFRMLGKMTLHPGHSLFAFNTKTAHLRKVDLKREAIFTLERGVLTKSKNFIEPDTVYVPALNAKNALKKILKSFIHFQNQSS